MKKKRFELETIKKIVFGISYLSDESGIGERGTDVVGAVEVSVPRDLVLDVNSDPDR